MNATDRAPQIVAIAHQKGGTGKTTTVCNLAASLADRENGLRVIVIDLDPQAAASVQLCDEELSVIGAYDVIVAGHVARAAIQPTKIKNCLLIPATQRLVMSEMDAQTRAISFEEVSQRLRDNLQGSDIILLDCPAGFGTIATMAMTIADLVIVPTPPLHFESRALRQTIEHMDRLRRQARGRLAVVLTMVDLENPAQRQIAEQIREEWRSVLVPVEVPRDPAMDGAVVAGELIVDFDPASPAAHAYRQLASEIGRRVGFDLPDVPDPAQPNESADAEGAPAPSPTPPPTPAPTLPPPPIQSGPIPEILRQPPATGEPAPDAPTSAPAPDLAPAPELVSPTLPPAPAAPELNVPDDAAPNDDEGWVDIAEQAPADADIVPPSSDPPSPQPRYMEAATTPAPGDTETDGKARPTISSVFWKLLLVVALMAVAGVATFLVLVDIGFLPWVLGAALILLIFIFPALLFRLF